MSSRGHDDLSLLLVLARPFLGGGGGGAGLLLLFDLSLLSEFDLFFNKTSGGGGGKSASESTGIISGGGGRGILSRESVDPISAIRVIFLFPMFPFSFTLPLRDGFLFTGGGRTSL